MRRHFYRASAEYKNKVIKHALPLLQGGQGTRAVADSVGVSKSTLNRWLAEARKRASVPTQPTPPAHNASASLLFEKPLQSASAFTLPGEFVGEIVECSTGQAKRDNKPYLLVHLEVLQAQNGRFAEGEIYKNWFDLTNSFAKRGAQQLLCAAFGRPAQSEAEAHTWVASQQPELVGAIVKVSVVESSRINPKLGTPYVNAHFDALEI